MKYAKYLSIFPIVTIIIALLLSAAYHSPVTAAPGTVEPRAYLPLVLKPEATPTPFPEIRIVHILYSPPGSDVENEYVQLRNEGGFNHDMTDWRLFDEANTTYIFPDGFVLTGGAEVKVWVRDGMDTATDLYWGNSWSIWNNAGDTATLTDAEGTVIDQCTYVGDFTSTDC